MNTTSLKNRYVLYLPVSLLVCLMLYSCSDMAVDDTQVVEKNSEISGAGFQIQAGAGPAYFVEPGSSIQEAVDQAVDGGTIHIKPGLYVEAVTVTQPNIRIRGMKGPDGSVIIENPGDINNGINVRAGADNFALSHVEVRGFDRNGVFLIDVDGFDIRHVKAYDNGEYGIYPVRSKNGNISHSEASGHADAGFYVGQASDIRIMHSVAYENVIGIEASNSDDILITHNKSYNNTAGVLAALLPGRTIKEANRIILRHNRVWDNNLPNFADHGLALGVPQGSGILGVGIDHSLIEKNTVTGNEFVGIALGSSLALGQLAGVPPEAADDIEPNSDNVTISKNYVVDNGTAQPPIPFPATDLLWDGSGSGNCWEKNTYETSVPDPLPACN